MSEATPSSKIDSIVRLTDCLEVSTSSPELSPSADHSSGNSKVPPTSVAPHNPVFGDDVLLFLEEASKIMRMPLSTLKEKIRRREISSVKMGARRMIFRSAIIEYTEQRTLTAL